MSDGDLAGEMKHNKAAHWLSFITSRGVYQEAMFEEDADRIQAYYRDKGYIGARVGQPEIKILQDEKDGKTRNVELKVPSPKAIAIASAASTSRATRSSRPRACGRCSS